MLLERDPPVDWGVIIIDLRRWGWTMVEVESATGVPRTTLLGWLNEGKQPMKFEDARAVLKLHAIESEKRKRDTVRA